MLHTRHVLAATAAVCLIGISGTGWSYDEGLAASYAKLFAPVVGAKAGKELHLMKAEVFIEKIKAGEPISPLDVRTPGETSIFTTAFPGALIIPINELFAARNLARIPQDRPVVVLCKSGTRATAAGTALRHVGFDNVYILKGGYKALSAYLGPKTANTPPKVRKSQ